MKKQRTELGTVIEHALSKQGVQQNELAASINQSPSYVSQVLRGNKRPSAQWVELVADTLKLTEKQRKELHLKAARQLGFKL